MPRYFVTAAIGISTFVDCDRPFLSVDVTWTDFVSFIFILHFLSQSWVRFKWCCKCCAAVRGWACVAKITILCHVCSKDVPLWVRAISSLPSCIILTELLERTLHSKSLGPLQSTVHVNRSSDQGFLPCCCKRLTCCGETGENKTGSFGKAEWYHDWF